MFSYLSQQLLNSLQQQEQLKLRSIRNISDQPPLKLQILTRLLEGYATEAGKRSGVKIKICGIFHHSEINFFYILFLTEI